MPAEPNQLEALKMLSEWCKWVVALQTGAITLIGAMATAERTKFHLATSVGIKASISIGAFTASSVVALVLLAALPMAVQDIKPGERILDRQFYAFDKSWGNLALLAHLLAGFCISGLITFAMATITQVLSVK